jgi:hypothetical protein
MYLIIQITNDIKFIYIYILYYKVLETSYTNLILNRIVILFLFLSIFVLKVNFFFIIFKTFTSSIC